MYSLAGISEPDSSNDIQLILSEGRKLVMDGKESRLHYKEGGKIAISSGKTQLDEENETGYNQLIVPSGKRSFITFSDGTPSSRKCQYPYSIPVRVFGT